MPGTHSKPSTQYKQYTGERLKTALDDVENGVSFKKASQTSGVPRTTLRRIAKNGGKREKAGRKTILTKREEDVISEWVKENGRRGFGKNSDQVCEAVRQVLNRAGRKVNVFTDNRPGRTWWCGFLRRHPDLHMLSTKPLEISRATACTEEVVFKWFDAFENFLKEHNVTSPDQIYNCDESGFPLQTCSKKKVCVDEVTKRAFHISSATKTLITTLQCISASGYVVPPAVYFPSVGFHWNKPIRSCQVFFQMCRNLAGK